MSHSLPHHRLPYCVLKILFLGGEGTHSKIGLHLFDPCRMVKVTIARHRINAHHSTAVFNFDNNISWAANQPFRMFIGINDIQKYIQIENYLIAFLVDNNILQCYRFDWILWNKWSLGEQKRRLSENLTDSKHLNSGVQHVPLCYLFAGNPVYFRGWWWVCVFFLAALSQRSLAPVQGCWLTGWSCLTLRWPLFAQIFSRSCFLLKTR